MIDYLEEFLKGKTLDELLTAPLTEEQKKQLTPLISKELKAALEKGHYERADFIKYGIRTSSGQKYN